MILEEDVEYMSLTVINDLDLCTVYVGLNAVALQDALKKRKAAISIVLRDNFTEFWTWCQAAINTALYAEIAILRNSSQ